MSNDFVCVDCGAKVWTVEPHPTDRCTLHQAVFEQREKDAAMVRSEIRDGGIPMDGPAVNRMLESIAKGIESDGQ